MARGVDPLNASSYSLLRIECLAANAVLWDKAHLSRSSRAKGNVGNSGRWRGNTDGRDLRVHRGRALGLSVLRPLPVHRTRTHRRGHWNKQLGMHAVRLL